MIGGSPSVSGEESGAHKFVLNGVTIECKVATLDGTSTSSTLEELPLEAAYEECTAAGVKVSIVPACTYDIPTQTITKVSWSNILNPKKP